MKLALLTGISFITLAFIFYTAGIFKFRKKKFLKWNHIILFWLGFLFDLMGTLEMSTLKGIQKYNLDSERINAFHTLSGILAILIMLVFSLWATFIFVRDREEEKLTLYKFSLWAWIIWLIPYTIGIYMGMRH